MEKERLKANRKRSKQLTILKGKNIMLAKEIQMYIKHQPAEKSDKVDTLVRRLWECSAYTLYAMDSNGQIRLISPKTCNHKLCNICNWNRQKKVRRKYARFFENNQYLCKVSQTIPMKRVADKEVVKYCTKTQLESYLNKGFKLLSEKTEYDLMHLVLTVPHTVEGWRGNDIYIKEIIQAFKQLRRLEFWNNWVYGGEYGVETTLNADGYHTHIHALLMVRKDKQNRNQLHFEVLMNWNRITSDDYKNRKLFDIERFNDVRKGNKSVLCGCHALDLDPDSATFIHLRRCYMKQFDGKTWKKVEYKQWNDDVMMRAVMETISYHFKPKTFQKVNLIEKGTKYYSNEYDVEKILKILPKIYGERLYNKFGVLEHEQSLNITDNSYSEDYEETTEDINEETGEVLERRFFITSPRSIYHDNVTGELKLANRTDVFVKELKAKSGREAVKELAEFSKVNKYN